MKPAALANLLGTILWAGLIGAIALTAFRSQGIDLWWQLRQGLDLLATGRLPTAPPAAFGLPHQPFVDEYSLYEIGLALLDRAGGLGLVHLVFAGVFLAIFAIPLRAAGRPRLDALSLSLLVLAGVFLIKRQEQRPELIGVLLFVLLLALLRRTHVGTPGFLLRVALLFAVWTNVHSSYLFGLLALVIWLAERTFLPREGWNAGATAQTLAVAGGALLINPYGLERLAFTWEQEHDIGSNLLSGEMWPVWDQTRGVAVLLGVAGALLLAAALARPRASAWLLVLAGGLYVLSLDHFRHVSFLAATLLYLYAGRPEVEAVRTGWMRVLVLGIVALAVLELDLAACRVAVTEARRDAAGLAFARGLLAHLPAGSVVLCHESEGSYFNLHGPTISPLIDTGMGRFDDATKRLYFFLVQQPAAFDLALARLPALNAVLVTRSVQGWTLSMRLRVGWHLAAVDPRGLLFLRDGPEGSLPIDSSLIAELVRDRDRARQEGDPIRAFGFSALANAPAESLALLDRSPPSAWSEGFFNFARAWVLSLPPRDVCAWNAASHALPVNALLREIILARNQTSGPLPPAGTTLLERLARCETLLERHDLVAARTLFLTLHPPRASALYASLRSDLQPAVEADATLRWQDWNAGGEGLLDRLAPLLNARARQLSECAAHL